MPFLMISIFCTSAYLIATFIRYLVTSVTFSTRFLFTFSNPILLTFNFSRPYNCGHAMFVRGSPVVRCVFFSNLLHISKKSCIFAKDFAMGTFLPQLGTISTQNIPPRHQCSANREPMHHQSCTNHSSPHLHSTKARVRFD